ncbi:MAG TPA: N-6 DNA methylase [Solirubrobacteraceae bacterium]|nr:N-6 DNA methylase [Solirubrobacteraceae bacterium]
MPTDTGAPDPATAAGLSIEAVPEGRVVDFITGAHVKDTPEEYVRQNIEKALVVQYRFPKADCQPEFPIKVGSGPKKRVDIVVFNTGEPHEQERAYVLVETKKPGQSPHAKKDGVEQLKSYMAACLNANYGLWTNGTDRYCFAKRDKGRGKLEFEEIVEIPAFAQTEEDAQRPKRQDLKVATGDNLLYAFRRCHNYIAANEGIQKPEAFWELLKIIFCKIEDERSRELTFYATPSELKSRTSAATTKSRIQKLFTDNVVKDYPSIFVAPDAQEIQLNPSVLAFVVAQLQGFSLLASPVDVKGVAYEEVVGSNLRGDRGEFFTPRNACRMAVAMLDPQPGERLLDPACGTGGFLITAMNHALTKLECEESQTWSDPDSPTEPERQELYRKRMDYLTKRVFGLDLNPNLVRAAKMNMVMNNDGSGGHHQANSLANPHTWNPEVSDAIRLGSIDILFTNPPFGANIVIDDEEILRQYELAAIWDQESTGSWAMRRDRRSKQPVLQKSQPPEILFIERCVQFLVPGTGCMAMVLPNGILNNPALAYVRHWILGHTQVLAVVDMARELFQPRNDTQTSMILMRRLSVDELALSEVGKFNYDCFMAVTEKIGHDKRGNTIYRRNADGDDVVVLRREAMPGIDPNTGEHINSITEVKELLVDDELPDVADAYRAWLPKGEDN